MSLDTNLHEDVVDEFYHGRTVIDTSAAQVVAANVPNAVKGLQLKAGPTNSATIYIGKFWVTMSGPASTDGLPLLAGEGLFVPVKDVSSIYAIATDVSQDLHWFMV